MGFKKRLKYLLKNNAFIQKIYVVVFSLVFKFIGLFVRRDNKLILFSSFGGLQFNDSPKVLYEYIKQSEEFSGYKLIWAFENPSLFDLPTSEKVKIDSFKYFITALKAKIWITSVNIERGLKFKKKGTIYVNTWHGTGPKYTGNKVAKRKDYDFSNVDILCCDGWYLKQIMVNDHNANPENCLLSGRPREDWLYNYNENDATEIKEKLKIPLDKKVILYAPTWRESKTKGKDYSLEIPIEINKWKTILGDEYVVLFRGHIFTDKILNLEFDNFLINVSDYLDINHLYVISDLLISDYSSVFFDYAILKRPMYCFAFDYEYYSKSRGLHIDLKKEFPNGIYYDEESLLHAIINENNIDLIKKVEYFYRKYVNRTNNATDIVIKELLNLLNNDNKKKN